MALPNRSTVACVSDAGDGQLPIPEPPTTTDSVEPEGVSTGKPGRRFWILRRRRRKKDGTKQSFFKSSEFIVAFATVFSSALVAYAGAFATLRSGQNSAAEERRATRLETMTGIWTEALADLSVSVDLLSTRVDSLWSFVRDQDLETAGSEFGERLKDEEGRADSYKESRLKLSTSLGKATVLSADPVLECVDKLYVFLDTWDTALVLIKDYITDETQYEAVYETVNAQQNEFGTAFGVLSTMRNLARAEVAASAKTETQAEVVTSDVACEIPSYEELWPRIWPAGNEDSGDGTEGTEEEAPAEEPTTSG